MLYQSVLLTWTGFEEDNWEDPVPHEELVLVYPEEAVGALPFVTYYLHIKFGKGYLMADPYNRCKTALIYTDIHIYGFEVYK